MKCQVILTAVGDNLAEKTDASLSQGTDGTGKPVDFQEAYSAPVNEMSLGTILHSMASKMQRDWGEAVYLERRRFQRTFLRRCREVWG